MDGFEFDFFTAADFTIDSKTVSRKIEGLPVYDSKWVKWIYSITETRTPPAR